MRKLALLLCTAALLTHSAPLYSQCQIKKLLPDDLQESDLFGSRVAIDGDRAVVGAYGEDGSSTGNLMFDTGAAYVFHHDGDEWVQEQRLFPSTTFPGDFYGFSVAIDGDVIAVGALFDDEAFDDAGAVFVFRYNGSTWVEDDKLMASDAAVGDRFGRDVGLCGNTLVVGARYAGDALNNSGSAYVFEYDPMTMMWNEEQELTASDPCTNDFFGVSVAIDSDVIVVGAFSDNDACEMAMPTCPPSNATCDSGSAYVFRNNGGTWMEEKKLTASDHDAEDEFGARVAVSGDVIAVGAALNDDACADCNSGSVYVYRYNGMDDWLEDPKVLAPDAEAGDLFGADVALSADLLVVGARLGDAACPGASCDSGAAYVFKYMAPNWVFDHKYTADDAQPGDALGLAVALWNGVAVVGSGLSDDACPMNTNCNSGAAYIFHADDNNYPFVRGDITNDESVNLSDAITLLNYLFAGSQIDCVDAADVNDSGDVTITDAFHLLCALFCSPTGPGPAAPTTDCYVDLTPDTLDCASCSCGP